MNSNNQTFNILEILCVTWFYFEFTIRFLSCPNKIKFLISPLNWIDFISILPYFIWLFVDNQLLPDFKNILRTLRILLIFRATRFSSSLRMFGHFFRASLHEFTMLSIYFVLGIIFFSSCMFYLEKDLNGRFNSIPNAIW
jgi:hypothetical protein